MKYLFVCISLALFAYINASPVYGGNHGGYGGGNHGGYGGDRVEYEQILVPSYGRGHGNQGYDRPQILRSAPSGSSASAAASAAAAAIAPGRYSQWAVPRYEIDGSYNGPSHGHGRGGY
ncbi:chorion protein S15 [Drosophila miranda]|uniref:chorion protein S15 n=1 Tax=Drosophila miranda TaxID=7229 RepID=UPI0007E7CCD4|nr:chorion protein S15 [Drosophila miranda]